MARVTQRKREKEKKREKERDIQMIRERKKV